MERKSLGKNGRQSVEPRGAGRGVWRGVGRSVSGRSSWSDDNEEEKEEEGPLFGGRSRGVRAAESQPRTKSSTTARFPKQPTKEQSSRVPISPPGARSTAKSSSSKVKKKSAAKPPKAESELHIWFALILLFVAVHLFLSCMSYLIYWEQDANVAYFSKYFAGEISSVENWGGKIGAVLSNFIMGAWLGIAGLLLPLYLAMWGLRLLRLPTLRFKKSMAATLAIMFLMSLSLGHFYGYDVEIFGSGLGGESGIYVAEWFERMIGFEGTTVLLLFLSVGLLCYANMRVIRLVSRYVKNYLESRSRRKIESRLRMERMARIERERREVQRQLYAEQYRVRQEEMEREAGGGGGGPTRVVQPASAVQNPLSDKYTPSENLIALEGGIWGYCYGYGEDGSPLYWYFDRAEWMSTYVAVERDSLHSSSSSASKPEEQDIIELRDMGAGVEDQSVERDGSSGDIVFTIEQTQEATSVATPPSQTTTVPPPGVDFEVAGKGEEETVSARELDTLKLYDPTAELPSYRKPTVDLLQDHSRKVEVTAEELNANKDRIVHTLLTFGIKIDSIKATIGPTVTLYEIVPAPGVRISKIKNLEDDIALTLSALGIRIIAPIPGKGTIGIEVPNRDKETVSMHSVIRSARFQDIRAELPIALGKTIQNETFVFDLAKMPHLLVAGATGQGKSVGLNAIIASLLYKKHPSELKFVLVDPKKVELTLYSKLEKHFLAKMEGEDEAIITDTQKVVYTLNSLCKEMDSRYDLLKMAQVRNIVEYNEKFIHRRLNPEKGHRYLPYFVVIIDEFADLIMTAGREIETPIARIAQLARAVGIHLIIATQRPTTNIITGVIKANFPARVAFRVTSMIDSRTILDTPGANQLIGRGDMLVSTGSEMTRVQCAFIDTPEVDDITNYISQQRGYISAYELPEYAPEGETSSKDVDMGKKDALFDEVARFVVDSQTGSASTIQRRFAIGFNRAGRIVDQLEAAGIVGAGVGNKPRQVLIQDPVSLENIISGQN